jgi:hypothetical protein
MGKISSIKSRLPIISFVPTHFSISRLLCLVEINSTHNQDDSPGGPHRQEQHASVPLYNNTKLSTKRVSNNSIGPFSHPPMTFKNPPSKTNKQ